MPTIDHDTIIAAIELEVAELAKSIEQAQAALDYHRQKRNGRPSVSSISSIASNDSVARDRDAEPAFAPLQENFSAALCPAGTAIARSVDREILDDILADSAPLRDSSLSKVVAPPRGGRSIKKFRTCTQCCGKKVTTQFFVGQDICRTCCSKNRKATPPEPATKPDLQPWIPKEAGSIDANGRYTMTLAEYHEHKRGNNLPVYFRLRLLVKNLKRGLSIVLLTPNGQPAETVLVEEILESA